MYGTVYFPPAESLLNRSNEYTLILRACCLVYLAKRNIRVYISVCADDDNLRFQLRMVLFKCRYGKLRLSASSLPRVPILSVFFMPFILPCPGAICKKKAHHLRAFSAMMRLFFFFSGQLRLEEASIPGGV